MVSLGCERPGAPWGVARGARHANRARPDRATFPRRRSGEEPGFSSGTWPAAGGRTRKASVTKVTRLGRLVERTLPLAVLATAVVGAPVMIFSPQGLPRLRGLERELADVEAENAQLRRESDALRGRVQRLREDPAAVERIARDDLGFVRQTEVVFQFSKR